MDNPVVTIADGKVLGRVIKNFDGKPFLSFQGIPYARPPTGKLRFKAPQPPEKWSGVLEAIKDGRECTGKHPVRANDMIGCEDCLRLNVFTPELPKNDAQRTLLPVMVFVHGGAFTSGSSRDIVYGPEFLLMEDIVLVTFNYRLGIMGFLALDDPSLEVPGNAGLKDMVMVLKWVQSNIAQFSGDPNNVTIFGQSSGAAAVHYLILSPMTRGLFHKAILQSGCCLNQWARGRKCAQEISEVFGLGTSDEAEILRMLQEMPLPELFIKSVKLPDEFIVSTRRPFGPVVEKHSKDPFLPAEPIDIIKSGNYNHVPMIFGFTTREGMLSGILQRPKKVEVITDFQLAVPYFLNLERNSDLSRLAAKKIKDFYYGDEQPSLENIDNYYVMEGDNFFVRGILRSVKFHLESTKQPIYLYRISVESELDFLKAMNDITTPGVCHSADLAYLFKWSVTPEIRPSSIEDVSIRRMVKLWTNFARRGNPNPEKPSSLIDVTWTPVEEKSLHFLDIGRTLTVSSDPESERMRFWEDIFKMIPINKL